MLNVTMVRKGNKLTIEVDLSQDHGPSASGKTTLVASTKGNVHVEGPEGVVLGLNVYKPRAVKAAA